MKTPEKYQKMMLDSFERFGIDRFDIGVRRNEGTFIFHESQDLDRAGVEKRFKWLKYENRQGSEIYIRPARGHSWNYLFLDDLNLEAAREIAAKHRTMLIQTSAEGGCHAWLCTSRAITEPERYAKQSDLAQHYGADKMSVSGEHWGRFAGFRNHKRGSWVNWLITSDSPPMTVSSISTPTGQQAGGCVIHSPSNRTRPISRSIDDSPSGAEWGWVMGFLSATGDAQRAIDRLAEQADARGKSNPRSYAERTVRKAQSKLHGENGLAG